MTAPPVKSWHAETGAKVLEYELTRRLGAGGMGAVFEARAGERVVALKVLSKLDDLSLRMRFAREAEALARVDSHPNVLRIYGVHLEFEPPFLLLELVQGRNLREVLREREGRPLPLSRALEIARDLHSALRCLHENGVLHRDVKAENILIEEGSGRARLADFGLASIQDGQSLTRSGEVMGTAGSMAPEQIAGEALTSAADCWALGVVLYELLTGQAPFRGASSMAVMQAVLQGPIPAPVRLRPELPQSLSELCLALLRRDPGARLTSAEEIAGVLSGNSKTDLFPSFLSFRIVGVLSLAILLGAGLLFFQWAQAKGPEKSSGQERLIQDVARCINDFNFHESIAPSLRERLRQKFVDVFLSSLPYAPSGPEPSRIGGACLESAKNLRLALSAPGLELASESRLREFERLRTRAEITLAIAGQGQGESHPVQGQLETLFSDLRLRRTSEVGLKTIAELSASGLEEFDGLGELIESLCAGRRKSAAASSFSEREIDVLDGMEIAERMLKAPPETELGSLRSEIVRTEPERSSRRLSLVLREVLYRVLRSGAEVGLVSDWFNRLDELSFECSGTQQLSIFQPFSKLIEAFLAQGDRARAVRVLEESVEGSLASREGLDPKTLRAAVRQACVARALGSEMVLAARFPFGNFVALGNSSIFDRRSSRSDRSARLEFFLELAAAGVYCTTLVTDEDLRDPRLTVLLTQFHENPRLAAPVRLLSLRLMARALGDLERSPLSPGAGSTESPVLMNERREAMVHLLSESRDLYRTGGLFDASRDQAFSCYVTTLTDALSINGLRDSIRGDFDVSMTLSWAESVEESHHFRRDWILYILIQCFLKAQVYPEVCVRLIRKYFPLLDARLAVDRPIWTDIIEEKSARRHRYELASGELSILGSLGRRSEIEPRAREIYASSAGSFEAQLIKIEALILLGRSAEALALNAALVFPEGREKDDVTKYHDKLQQRYEILKPK
jgi:serine/threonine protein kinase